MIKFADIETYQRAKMLKEHDATVQRLIEFFDQALVESWDPTAKDLDVPFPEWFSYYSNKVASDEAIKQYRENGWNVVLQRRPQEAKPHRHYLVLVFINPPEDRPKPDSPSE